MHPLNTEAVAYCVGRADLLAALCGLEASLAPYAELSDQLLLHAFLQLPLWARGGYAMVAPLLRQLYRMASEAPEQWARTEAVCRLLDAMQDDYPWRDTAHVASSETSRQSAAAPPLAPSMPPTATSGAPPPVAPPPPPPPPASSARVGGAPSALLGQISAAVPLRKSRASAPSEAEGASLLPAGGARRGSHDEIMSAISSGNFALRPVTPRSGGAGSAPPPGNATPRGGAGGLAVQLASELAVAMRKRRVSLAGGEGETLLATGAAEGGDTDDEEEWERSGSRGIYSADR